MKLDTNRHRPRHDEVVALPTSYSRILFCFQHFSAICRDGGALYGIAFGNFKNFRLIHADITVHVDN